MATHEPGDINGTLYYHTTLTDGYSVSVWDTASGELTCKEVRLRLHNSPRLDYDQLRVQVGLKRWDDCTRTDLTNGTEFFTVTYMNHTESQPNAIITTTSLSKFLARGC